MSSGPPILVTGATGYVGGRLVHALLARGERVRCLARRPEAIAPQPGLEVVAGDALDPVAVRHALDGADVAYYLVHAMGAGEGFEERDRRAASIFAGQARSAGVRRIVYLGGLGSGATLSTHLASRQEVGRLLASTGVETIEFRASIVIGSGSLSFELVRSLTERLPLMVTPRWVRTQAQPIAIEDVVAYLVAALDLDAHGSEVLEIGGADVATYGELMREYARQRGLRRLLVPVPVLTPRLSSLWLGLVTPVYARVGRTLVESLPHETVVRDPSALERFPIRPRGYREAIARALRNEDRELAETRWSDALSSGARAPAPPERPAATRRRDSRTRVVPVPPAQAFAPIRRIGGSAGWYYGDGLWRLRGFVDLLVGGVGLRRGRRDPETPAVGSALDFWRVEAYEPERLLRLRAEMRLPGRAWLQFEVEGDERSSRLRQTAVFDPSGLAGLAYWYALLPLHAFVFRGMLAGIARAATDGDTRSFEHRHVVSGGLTETFAFFADPANLPRLTPRLLRFRVVERPAQVGRGARFRYRVGPIDWVAEIAAWDPPGGFADVQVRGPYRVWRHRHELAEHPAGTEVRDVVEYRLRGGSGARLLEPAHRVFLRVLFAYRSRRVDELLG
jgi:uncharacterized protein YbjT (DUF2867 family)/ligand-binding SRPBCC domain-containing protein